MAAKIGYFYLVNSKLIGEAFGLGEKSYYEGHAAFWEAEFAKLFPGSPDIMELRLCWYGCDRGRITCFDGQYILLGTKGIFKSCDSILGYYGLDDKASVRRITDDEHYRIMAGDAELLKRNQPYFKLPEDYEYLLGG